MNATHPAETGDVVADARRMLKWASSTHGAGLCLTASFGDATLVHLAANAVPGIEVTLLDTGYLFAETEWFAEMLRERLDISLRIIRPAADLERDVWQTDTTACCKARKVEPLDRALAGRTAWVTGLRRDDSPDRRGTPLMRNDLMRNIVKINPLAMWSDDDVATYARDYDVPEHPLVDRGYETIGC